MAEDRSDVNEDRLFGKLTIYVKEVSELKKVTHFGVMDPYVTFILNQEKKHTKTVEDGGYQCTFDETIVFNVDCEKQDLFIIKVRTKNPTFGTSTIGSYSVKMGDLVKLQKHKLKFQLVDEETYTEPRGFIELVPDYTGLNDI